MFPCVFARVCVSACISLSAGLGVMLPTDQQFWKHCSSLALREEDEACQWVSVCVGRGDLTSESEERVSPAVCLCVSVFERGLQHAPTFRNDSSVLVCSACSRGYLYVVRCGGTPLAPTHCSGANPQPPPHPKYI